jgi:hypothetical protein
MTILKTFKARLKGSQLEWIGDVPELGEQTVQVHVTLLEDSSVLESETRGQRMAEILEKLAATPTIGNVDPIVWQQDIRQERSLPGR